MGCRSPAPSLRVEEVGWTFRGTGRCHLAIPPAGVSLTAELARFRAELRRDDSDHRWLLGRGLPPETVVSLADDALRVCFERDVPDWRERFSHPALFPPPAPTAPDDTRVVTGDDAKLLGEDPRYRLRPAPELRAAYGIWANPAGRWVADPPFRHWLAAAIDREAMAVVLVGDAGEPIERLVASAAPVGPPPPAYRPYSDRSRPRIPLLHRADDPWAARVASRLRAELGTVHIELQPQPLGPAALREAVREGAYGLLLYRHRAEFEDPVLAAQAGLREFGLDGGTVWEALVEAARLEDRAARRAAVRRIEDRALRSGELIPLLAVDAWLATPRAAGRAAHR